MLELSALNHLDDLIQLFITQYHSLKVKTRMSKGLWDLIQVAIGSLDNKPEIKAELEFLLKPSNGSSSSNQSPQEIITLSPMSESNSLETPKANAENEMVMMNKLGIQLDEAISVSSLPRYFNAASSLLLESCKGQGNDDDSDVRMSVRFLQQLRDVDLHVFDDIFTTWLRDQVEPALLYNTAAFTKLLLFCVIYECVSLEKIADIFMQLKSVRLPGSTVNSRLMMVVTSSKDLENISLKPSEELLLDVQRRVFERSKPKIYLKYIVQEIINSKNNENETTSVATQNLCNGTQWCRWISDFLLWLSTVDFDLLMAGLVDPILEKKDIGILRILRNIVNSLLHIPDIDGDHEQELLNLIKVCNDFNVSLCQVQIKVILESLRLETVIQHQQSDQTDSSSSFIEAASRIILSCASKGINLQVSKSVFGDLIIHLDKGIKGELLYQCEVKFLKSAQFPIVQNDGTQQKNNIVGVLLEIVDAIADSCTRDICISHVFDVEKCLEKLIAVCEESHLDGTATKVVDVTPPPVAEVEVKVESKESMDVDIDIVITDTSASASSNSQTSETIHYSKTDINDAVMLFVKIVMIHFHCSPPQSQQGNLLRDKIIHCFSILRDTAVIKGLPDLSGLLLDALNAIREDLAAVNRITARPGSTTAISPLAGRSTLFPSSNNSTPNSATSHQPISNALAAAAAATSSTSIHPTTYDQKRYSYLSNLVVYDKSTDTYSELKVRSFDLLEEGNPVMSINDAPLNLAMFDSATERNNPA